MTEEKGVIITYNYVCRDEKVKKLFLESFIFQGAKSETLERLFCEGKLIKAAFMSGEQINTDSFRGCVGIIISGRAKAKTASKSKDVLLNVFEKGSVFGYSSLFLSGEDHLETEIIAKGSCSVIFIDEATLKELITEDSAVAINLISVLCEKIRFLNKKIAAFTGENAEEKLLKYLRQKAVPEKANGEELYVFILKNAAQLSRTLDIGRASLYRALDSLEKKGIILKQDKKIILTERNQGK